MPPGPQDIRLQDIVGDGIWVALYDHYDQYWGPINELSDEYLAAFESCPDVREELSRLSAEPPAGQDFYSDAHCDTVDGLAKRIDDASVAGWLDARPPLESRYALRRAEVVEHIIDTARARFRFLRGGIVIHRITPFETFEWISAAISTGVVGNLGYDILKKGWGATWRAILRGSIRRSSAVADQVDSDEALQYLVKVAVREQCRRLNFPVPDVSAMQIIEWTPSAQTVTAVIRSASPELRATVEIPYSGIEDRGVRVSLFRTA